MTGQQVLILGGASAIGEQVARLLASRGAALYLTGRDRPRLVQIVGIGSVAGDRGRATNDAYGAAKGALEIFLSGLRQRLSRRGVKVLLAKPGFVDTPMTVDFKKGPSGHRPSGSPRISSGRWSGAGR